MLVSCLNGRLVTRRPSYRTSTRWCFSLRHSAKASSGGEGSLRSALTPSYVSLTAAKLLFRIDLTKTGDGPFATRKSFAKRSPKSPSTAMAQTLQAKIPTQSRQQNRSKSREVSSRELPPTTRKD